MAPIPPSALRLLTSAALCAGVLSPLPGRAPLAAQLTDPFERSFAGVVNNERETTSGAAWSDMDGDGDPDLFVSAYSNRDNLLYENLGDGSFRRVGGALPASDAGLSSGAAWADVDGDGREDLFVANQQGQDNFLYRNLGGGRFELVDGPVTRDRGDSYSGSFADFDADGDVDLFVANRSGQADFLYRNLGDGRFERVGDGPVAAARGSSFVGAWGDVDGDGLPDLFVTDSDPGSPNSLYRNLGGGAFERVAEGPVSVDAAVSERAAWGDFDNDGDLDLYVTNGGFFGGQEEVPFLYRNDGGRLVRVTTGPAVTEAVSGSDAAWLDLDDDGDLDLFVGAYRDHNLVLRNEGSGSFVRFTAGWAARHGGFTDAASPADADLDGDVDLYLTHWEAQNDMLLTNAGNPHHWLSVRLVGAGSNTSAVGATVRATATIDGREVTQLRVVGMESGGRGQGDRPVRFGLGDAAVVERLEIRWPAGGETVLGPLHADRFLTVREGEGVVAAEAPRTDAATRTARAGAAGRVARAFLADGVEAATEAYGSLAGSVPHPDRARALAAAARYLFDAAAAEGGLALAERALEDAPDDAAVAFTAAELRRASGDARGARVLYRRVLELLPAARDLDPDEVRWMERTSGRYAGG